MVIIALIVESHWMFGNIRAKHFETTILKSTLSHELTNLPVICPRKYTNLCRSGPEHNTISRRSLQFV